MKELVSIIVPVYRAAAYIAETIAMVEAQTWQDWELILVDDCSPDNSAEVIRNILQKQAGRDNAARQSCEGVQAEVLMDADGQAEVLTAAGVRTEMFTGAGGQPVMLLQKQKNEGAARARNTGLDMAGISRFWMRMMCGIRRSWSARCGLCGKKRPDLCSRLMSSATVRPGPQAGWCMSRSGLRTSRRYRAR